MDKTRLSAVEKWNTSHESSKNIEMIQNVLLIWLHENNEDCLNTIIQLRHVVSCINTFTDVDQAVDFLTDIHDENILMIISDTLCQTTVPLIHNISQLHTIIIYCNNKAKHDQWSSGWYKIKGIFTEISLIYKNLESAARQCEQNSISISFVNTTDDISSKNVNQLDCSFMYTQILKEILLSIEFEENNFKEFLDYCSNIFAENEDEPINLNKLIKKYRKKAPIEWYTCEFFLYSTLNRALRLMDTKVIIKIGCFVCDLHHHIEQLHDEQFSNQQSNESFTVYRGQGLSKAHFNQLINTIGGLVAFNNFLSTSKDRSVALAFAESNLNNSDCVGILFSMTIDPSKATTPFACINDSSYFQEEDEVLFSMHTVFRICDVIPMNENRCFFQVNLSLTDDNDIDLRMLSERIREETYPNSIGWYRLDLLLLKMGEFDKAQEVNEFLLNQTTDDNDKAHILGVFAAIKCKQEEYDEAIKYFEMELEIYEKTFPLNHLCLAMSYNNTGNVYEKMGKYSKALSYQQKALEIRQQLLPPNHPEIAGSYSNIATFYRNMNEFSKALSFEQKALEIRQQSLPRNHPDIAASYNNIGLLNQEMGNFSTAFSSQQKALEIRQQSLPPNHPDIAASYNNIAMIYADTGEHLKALLTHEKALKIRQQSISRNHPDLIADYNNIGSVYVSMDKYTNALSSFERALDIAQRSLPSDHPLLKMCRSKVKILREHLSM